MNFDEEEDRRFKEIAFILKEENWRIVLFRLIVKSVLILFLWIFQVFLNVINLTIIRIWMIVWWIKFAVEY